MEWNDTTNTSARVKLAVARLPSRVLITHPNYDKPFWVQIGGLRASGIELLRKHGKTIQKIVDLDFDPTQAFRLGDAKFFDLLTIDVRGVNNIRPILTCFPTPLARDVWMLEEAIGRTLEESESDLPKLWARSQALGSGCSTRLKASDQDGDRLAFNMNTPPVIADIVAVIERHRQEKQARALIEEQNSSLTVAERSEILERTKWSRDKEKLSFWGFSYGTITGASFAAAHPDRVRRMVLDGVADTTDYYLGQWLANPQDTDVVFDKLSEHCDTARPEKCPLYVGGGSKAIAAHMINILDSLKEQPLAVPAVASLLADNIMYYDLKVAIAGEWQWNASCNNQNKYKSFSCLHQNVLMRHRMPLDAGTKVGHKKKRKGQYYAPIRISRLGSSIPILWHTPNI